MQMMQEDFKIIPEQSCPYPTFIQPLQTHIVMDNEMIKK